MQANPFHFAFENKRYHTLAFENRARGYKLHKAVVDAGFTCPNIDGTLGTGGCIFCSGGSGYFTAPPELSIEEQLRREMARLRKRDPAARAAAYFQAHTNTYAPVETLREDYERALQCEGICALSIATRPDTLPEPVLDLLSEFNERTALTVELGLQTIHERTAKQIRRGYPLPVFENALRALQQRQIRTCVHLIDGLPGETPRMMLESAAYLGALRPDGVKLQLLHVIRGTPLEKLYLAGKYTPMSLEAYVSLVCRQLELLPEEIVIERITGDGDRRTLVAPLWSRDKIRVLGSIDKTLADRDSWQGRFAADPFQHIEALSAASYI